MPTRRKWGWFWPAVINDVSGRRYRFFGLAVGHWGIGILTHDYTEPSR